MTCLGAILVDGVCGSSSTLILDGGRSDNREGVFNGLRILPFKPDPGGCTLLAIDGLLNPLKLSFGAVVPVGAGVARGDSGRGRDGRRTRGRGTDWGPTDLLKLAGIDGRDGVGGVVTVRFVTYLELLMGTKMPAPGIVVVK